MKWPIGIVIFAILILWLCHLAVEQDKKEYTEKFQKCMADIHNVYVCETWARGKDVEVYYVPIAE